MANLEICDEMLAQCIERWKAKRRANARPRDAAGRYMKLSPNG